ncbi:SCO family protein [Parachitinimonas caeni]|uniref:SCO family protein n=1 Tax=Parachitinimonas caeni TaxID=3031301 RepID=A0ABT7DVV6_9NEIS|nr:SCO family protein [Parachitinimonas caeni]MDK2124191.1 SCO family protein [Parachitinimonas caeni]
MKITRFASLLAGLLVSSQLLAAPTLPTDSLLQLKMPLTSQRNEAVELPALAGKPLLITMFYGNCKTACPVILHSVKATVDALPAAQRERITALLVSLDPEHDTAQSLGHMAHEQGMSAAPWLFAVSDSDTHTRQLAASLGIRYRKLENGEINHSSKLIVTDRQGRIVASSDKLGNKADPAIVAALQAQLK